MLFQIQKYAGVRLLDCRKKRRLGWRKGLIVRKDYTSIELRSVKTRRCCKHIEISLHRVVVTRRRSIEGNARTLLSTKICLDETRCRDFDCSSA